MPATARTRQIWERFNELSVEERRKGGLDISQIPSSFTAHALGYIDREGARGDVDSHQNRFRHGFPQV